MEKLIFEDYEFEIKMPNFINIIGMPNSGKTTLLRMLINQVPDANIHLDDKKISDYDLDFKKRNISACLNLDFNTAYVKEELVFYLEKCGYPVNECFDKLDAFSEYFDLEEIINNKIKYLSLYDKAFVKILSLLILNPQILGIDNLLTYLNHDKKIKIIKYAKENKITVLNVTSDKEELLLATETVVIESHKARLHDKTKEIIADEKLLISVGFELPFIINISNGCKLYDILKKDCYDIKSLVGVLWK